MLEDRCGVAVHQYPGAWPSKEEQIGLGIKYIRVLVQNFALLAQQLKNDLAPDVKIVALLNPQTPGVNTAADPAKDADNVDGWMPVVTNFAQQFSTDKQTAVDKDIAGKVCAVECLNQWDDGKNTPQQAVDCAT